jgi:hypothetical protein
MKKSFSRRDVPSELADAKRAALERLLVGERARGHPWAVRSAPAHNVVGVGIGRKIKNSRLTGTRCVRFYVEHKLPREAIPREFLLPESIRGVKTDVIETGRFRAFLPAPPLGQTRLRPAMPGCSIGFQFGDAESGSLMAGTLGAVVETGGVRYILSNNHVLANENALPVGSPVYQPGLLDGGNAATDRIATLTRFVPLNSGGANLVDCAIAQVDNGAVDPTILPQIGRLTGPDPIDATDGMKVEKTGRATGYTTGAVTDVSANISVEFDIGLLNFADQILIKSAGGPFSDSGDSGSLVVDVASGRATGLLIGGTPQFAMANHIADVLQALNVSLVT